MDMTVDVAVLGAGPAGAVAAAGLAKAGLTVALFGHRPSGDHDVLVTGDAAAGVEHHTVPVMDVLFDDARRGELADLALAGCRYGALTLALEHTAITAGAARVDDVVTLTERNDRPNVLHGDRVVHATHVVIATGAPEAMPGTAPAHAQVCHGLDHDGRATLHLPAENDGLPTPILVTPSAHPSTVTVFATGYESADAALKVLGEVSPRFAALTPVGGQYTGRISVSFDPAAAVRDGAIVVGAAAGVTNPFVGTGIATAMTTGRLAAAAIAANADDPSAAAQAYVRALARDVIGHTGAAAQATRRYRLTWRVLSDTAGNPNPFFAKARRAILVPDGVRALGEPRRTRLRGSDAVPVAPFLFATTEIAVAAVRREWPFIAALIRIENDIRRQDLRPALLFAGAAIAAGATPDNAWAAAAAATELAMLGMLALTASGPTVTAADRGIDWPSASAVLAGDFLLAQATRLVATHQPDLAGPFADWMSELVATRARRVTGPPDPDASGDFFAAMFEFPVRIAAQLADGDDASLARLREFGNTCGRVFLQAEDLLALRGERTRLDATRDSLRDTRLSGLPDHTVLADVTAIAATVAACRATHARARALLRDRQDQVLIAFLDAVAAPAINVRAEEG